MGSTITLEAEVDLYKSDVLDLLDDKDLLEEIENRDISFAKLDFNKDELIESIKGKYSLIQGYKIDAFFEKLNKE